MSDAQQYRTKEEVEEYRKIDPISQVEKIIISKKYAKKSDLDIAGEETARHMLSTHKLLLLFNKL